MITLTSTEQALVKSDSAVKNFIVEFPNGEMSDLDNDNIVFESVSFNESVCSDMTFRFGCSDASVISFETVGVANMLGMTIKCKMVFTLGNNSVTIPYGTFVVDSCPRDHNAMTHRKVTAYAQTVSDEVARFEVYKSKIPRFYTDVYTPNVMHMVGAMSDDLLDDMTATQLSLATTSPHITGSELTSFELTDQKVLFLMDGGSGEEYRLIFGNDTTAQIHTREVEPDAVYKIKLTKGADYDTCMALAKSTAEANNLVLLDQTWFNSGVFNDWHIVGSSTTRVYPNELIKYNDMGSYIELIIYPYICDSNEFLGYDGFVGTWDLQLWDRATNTYTTIQANLEIFSSIEVTKYVAKVNSLRMSFNSTLQNVFPQGLYDNTASTPYVTFINAFSVRDIVEGYAELNASFGRCNRDGTLSILHLDNSSPYALTASDVQNNAWWDEYDINPIGSVLFKYKENEQEMTATYVFSSDPSVYDMTNNTLLQNLSASVATAADLADMTDTTKFYVYNSYLYFYDGTQWVQSVSYENYGSVMMALIDVLFVPYADTVLFTPLDADFVGMPYLQCGDAIQLTAVDGTVINSYILNHTFNGIQAITEDINTVQGEVIV